MPRPSQPVDDRTPIAGPRLDVAARVGWLLRTHRTVGGYSLREMSAALRDHELSLSPASLSRIESEGGLSAAALDGYALVLGLPAGYLCSPAETVCGAFRHALVANGPGRVTLERFSRAYDVIASGTATAGDWLEFARLHQEGSGFGLPARLMEREVERLATETVRGLTPARLSRRGALSALRRGPYAQVVGQVATRLVADPDAQGHWDLMDILSARPSPELVAWAGGLLSDPSTYTLIGAAHLLQSLLLKEGLSLEQWLPLVPLLEQAWEAAGEDPARRHGLSQLCGALPPPLKERVSEACCPDPAEPPAPRTWSRDRRNRHYGYATGLAAEACARLGQPEEPLLARLLFESFFDPRGVRMSCATVLLMASPFASEVVRLILERRDAAPDRASWLAALRVAAFCHTGEDTVDTAWLLESPDPVEFTHGLTIASRLDDPLPEASLQRGLAGDELLARRTLYCLGMQGDAAQLDRIAADPARPGPVRGGARWWREHGPRITV